MSRLITEEFEYAAPAASSPWEDSAAADEDSAGAESYAPRRLVHSAPSDEPVMHMPRRFVVQDSPSPPPNLGNRSAAPGFPDPGSYARRWYQSPSSPS